MWSNTPTYDHTFWAAAITNALKICSVQGLIDDADLLVHHYMWPWCSFFNCWVEVHLTIFPWCIKWMLHSSSLYTFLSHPSDCLRTSLKNAKWNEEQTSSVINTYRWQPVQWEWVVTIQIQHICGGRLQSVEDEYSKGNSSMSKQIRSTGTTTVPMTFITSC